MSSSSPLPLRQRKCQAPPGRRSISQTGIVQPSGPSSHCGTCRGSVHAAQTSRRGASNTRAITISRSEGVLNRVRPISVFAATIALLLLLFLLLHLFEVAVEPRMARFPEAAVAVRPLRHVSERRRVETAGAKLRLAAARNQAGALQHAQVLGDGGTADRERRRQLLHRGGAGGEAGEDRPSRRIGEGGEGGGERVYGPIGNHRVR